MLLIFFVLLNVLIGIIYEGFKCASVDPNLEASITDYERLWQVYDPNAWGWMSLDQFGTLLVELQGPLGWQEMRGVEFGTVKLDPAPAAGSGGDGHPRGPLPEEEEKGEEEEEKEKVLEFVDWIDQLYSSPGGDDEGGGDRKSKKIFVSAKGLDGGGFLWYLSLCRTEEPHSHIFSCIPPDASLSRTLKWKLPFLAHMQYNEGIQKLTALHCERKEAFRWDFIPEDAKHELWHRVGRIILLFANRSPSGMGPAPANIGSGAAATCAFPRCGCLLRPALFLSFCA
jgi:hypothetical protein